VVRPGSPSFRFLVTTKTTPPRFSPPTNLWLLDREDPRRSFLSLAVHSFNQFSHSFEPPTLPTTLEPFAILIAHPSPETSGRLSQVRLRGRYGYDLPYTAIHIVGSSHANDSALSVLLSDPPRVRSHDSEVSRKRRLLRISNITSRGLPAKAHTP
jgi:hypothetical protein